VFAGFCGRESTFTRWSSWTEIEHEFPLISEKDVRMLVRRNVGFVDFRKCAEIAMRIGRHPPSSVMFLIWPESAITSKEQRTVR
jgi:hypothetical protein